MGFYGWQTLERIHLCIYIYPFPLVCLPLFLQGQQHITSTVSSPAEQAHKFIFLTANKHPSFLFKNLPLPSTIMSSSKYSPVILMANVVEELQQSKSVFDQLPNSCAAPGQSFGAFLNNGHDHLFCPTHQPLSSNPSQSFPEGAKSCPSETWTCCDCGDSGMTTFGSACPGCGHWQCSNCELYRPKTRQQLAWHHASSVTGLDVNNHQLESHTDEASLENA
jgi:hypothetical protein